MIIKTKILIEVDVTVEGKYYKGKEGTFYSSNGDPGEPPEPSEFTISSVKLDNKDITSFLEEVNFNWDELEEKCIENFENNEEHEQY